MSAVTGAQSGPLKEAPDRNRERAIAHNRVVVLWIAAVLNALAAATLCGVLAVVWVARQRIAYDALAFVWVFVFAILAAAVGLMFARDSLRAQEAAREAEGDTESGAEPASSRPRRRAEVAANALCAASFALFVAGLIAYLFTLILRIGV